MNPSKPLAREICVSNSKAYFTGPINPAILLTIDVEDWFQVENFKQSIPFSSWSSYELRVEKNTHRLLNLLDLFSGQQSAVSNQPQALSEEYEGDSTVAGSIQKSASNEQGLSTDLHNASETDEAVSGRRRIVLDHFHPESDPGRKKSDKSSKSCLIKNSSPKATFFVLGWIAERLPHLVREIHSRGHEVASHGYSHNLCIECSWKDLRTDLIDSKNLLEDIIGDRVYGYRAPSFSINNDILKIIEQSGYLYDSSFNSFTMHGRYGHFDLSQNGKRGIALQISKTKHQESLPREIHDSDSEAYLTGAKSKIQNLKSKIFYELPISNLNVRNPFSPPVGAKRRSRHRGPVKFFKKDSKADLAAGSVAGLTGVLSAISSEQNRGSFVLPWGGGGYFRLTPFPLFKLGVEFILRQQNAYLFYLHPWEIDYDQPRVNGSSLFYKFRHYVNLSKTHSKLSKLIENFGHCNFITCSQYLDEVGKYAL